MKDPLITELAKTAARAAVQDPGLMSAPSPAAEMLDGEDSTSQYRDERARYTPPTYEELREYKRTHGSQPGGAIGLGAGTLLGALQGATGIRRGRGFGHNALSVLSPALMYGILGSVGGELIGKRLAGRTAEEKILTRTPLT